MHFLHNLSVIKIQLQTVGTCIFLMSSVRIDLRSIFYNSISRFSSLIPLSPFLFPYQLCGGHATGAHKGVTMVNEVSCLFVRPKMERVHRDLIYRPAAKL